MAKTQLPVLSRGRAPLAFLLACLVLLSARPGTAGALSEASLTFSLEGTSPLVFDADASVGGFAAPLLASASLGVGSAFAGTATTSFDAAPLSAVSVMVGANSGGAWTGSPLAGSSVVFTGTAKILGFGGVTIISLPLHAGQPGTLMLAGGGVTLTLEDFSWTAGTLSITGIGPRAAPTTVTIMGGVGPTPGMVSLVAATKIASNLLDPTLQTFRLDLRYDPSECGDGAIQGLEQCDDSNTTSGDGCDENCTPTGCGNFVVTDGEECDDGNQVGGDGCRSDCTIELCGDGIQDPGETCDDGNTAAGDGCSEVCRVETCGNGIVDSSEGCDDGNALPGDGCRPDCTIEACGDGRLDPQEECDDGNAIGGDGCRGDCTPELCGDGLLDPQEECDDGNAVELDGCSTACLITAVCGNGLLQPGEECDDGNRIPGDGCSADCTISVPEPGEALLLLVGALVMASAQRGRSVRRTIGRGRERSP